MFIVVFDAHDDYDHDHVYKLVNFACKEDFEEKGGPAERLGYISRSSAFSESELWGAELHDLSDSMPSDNDYYRYDSKHKLHLDAFEEHHISIQLTSPQSQYKQPSSALIDPPHLLQNHTHSSTAAQ